MTTARNEEDELLDESSSRVKAATQDDHDLSDGTSSDAAALETSSQATSSGNSTGQNSVEIFGFTKSSIAAVSCTRWVFLGALLLAAAGLATGVYITLDKDQYNDFTVEVRHYSCVVFGMARMDDKTGKSSIPCH
jgi:hypothetical protein